MKFLHFERLILALTLLCLRLPLTTAHDMGPRPVNHGLIGYGISMYHPLCAYSCRAAIASSPLSCSITSSSSGMPGMSMDMDMGDMVTTSPECYANDDTFLQTLAYCLYIKCTDVKKDELEKWWAAQAVGGAPVQPSPKETWADALARVMNATTMDVGMNMDGMSMGMSMNEGVLPTQEMQSGALLGPVNGTMLVNEADYVGNLNGQGAFEGSERVHEKFGLIILLTCFILPIFLSLLRFLPFPSRLTTAIHAHLLDPPLFGHRHNQPIGNLLLLPTRGQSLFLLYILLINLLLSTVSYHSAQPNAWFPTTSSEIKTYITNRAGVLSFANLPLVFLFAGRNNILLWVTNWSHSTFLLLHRWIAVIATVQACLHSAIYLQDRLVSATYAEESKLPYWICGVCATMAMVVALPSSIWPVRKRVYEVFLALHIVLAVATVVGCYLHITYRFQHQWGYEVWILIAIGMWSFDRVARIVRIVRNGVRWARVTVVDEEYVRLDVPGVAAQGHAYLYFPTLSWRAWESHPFSVAVERVAEQADYDGSDVEKAVSPLTLTKLEKEKKEQVDVAITSLSPIDPASDANNNASSNNPPTKGITFLLRTRRGTTALLRSRSRLPILLESSYTSPLSSLHHRSYLSHQLSFNGQKPDFILALAGGVGITALLPLLHTLSFSSSACPSTSYPSCTSSGNDVEKGDGEGNDRVKYKLHWSLRSPALAQSVASLHPSSWESMEKETYIGRRMCIPAIIEEAVERYGRDCVGEDVEGGKDGGGGESGGRKICEGGGVLVLVSGPPSMSDEVRSAVCSIGRKGGRVRLVEEGFSW